MATVTPALQGKAEVNAKHSMKLPAAASKVAALSAEAAVVLAADGSKLCLVTWAAAPKVSFNITFVSRWLHLYLDAQICLSSICIAFLGVCIVCHGTACCVSPNWPCKALQYRFSCGTCMPCSLS